MGNDNEKEIIDIIQKIKKLFNGKDIIAIIYNPFDNEGMKYTDCKFLRALFDNNIYTTPIFILNGRGEEFKTGISFPYVIKNCVKNYEVYVPSTCGSALCYTLFKANKLYVTQSTSITQIDPTIEYQEENLRAIKLMKSKDYNPKIKRYATEVFSLAESWIKKLCKYPSLFRQEEDRYIFEFYQLDDLATLFMNKEHHENPISTNELKGLGANIEEIKNNVLGRLSINLIKKCQDLTITQDVRVVFVTTNPLIITGGEQGHFICPLT